MRVADKLASIVAGAHDQAATDAHYERVADGVTNYSDGIFDKARAGMLGSGASRRTKAAESATLMTWPIGLPALSPAELKERQPIG